MGKKKGEKGFTLLEVLMGFIILAVGILGGQAMLIYRFNSDNFAKRKTAADNIAVNIVENARNAPYYIASTGTPDSPCALPAPDDNIVDCLRPDNLDDTALAFPYDSFATDANFSEVNNIWIKRTVTIQADVPAPEMKKITITIEWKESEDADETYEITYVTLRDRGVQ